jgi:hypothetical protein
MTADEKKVLEKDIMVIGRVAFEGDQPTLMDLESVLRAVCSESKDYRLYSVSRDLEVLV